MFEMIGRWSDAKIQSLAFNARVRVFPCVCMVLPRILRFSDIGVHGAYTAKALCFVMGIRDNGEM